MKTNLLGSVIHKKFAGERHRWWASILLLLAVSYSLANCVYSAAILDRTYDEYGHLEWSKRLWQDGVSSRTEKEIYNSKTPITLINGGARILAEKLGIEDQKLLSIILRLATIPWFIGLLLLVFWTCYRSAGWEAAYLATIAVALDPNIVAHASLITVDEAMTFAVVLVTIAYIHTWRKPTTKSAIFFGAALGFALGVKFSSLLLLALALPLILRALFWPQSDSWQIRVRRILVITIVTAMAAALVICTIYLFTHVGEPFGQIEFRSETFRSLAASVPNLRLPLPRDFLTGIDICLHHERGRDWNVVILGNWHSEGIWYYFIVLWLFKTPLTLILFQALLFYRLLQNRREILRSDFWHWSYITLVFLVYFSLLFRTQVGFRFVLMIIPLTWIALTSVAGNARYIFNKRKTESKNSNFVVAILILVLGTIGETVGTFGDPLTFSNLLIWPKHHAYKVLADSNIDWGQNHQRIKSHLRDNQISTHLDPPHFLPGHNTFQLNILTGVLWNFDQHKWLRENLEPKGHYLRTYLHYDIKEADFLRYINEERTYQSLSPGSKLYSFCKTQPESVTLGAAEPLLLEENEAKYNYYNICLKIDEQSDILIETLAGRQEVGVNISGSECKGQEASEGQMQWFRLQEGLHNLCIIIKKDGRVQFHAPKSEVSISVTKHLIN